MFRLGRGYFTVNYLSFSSGFKTNEAAVFALPFRFTISSILFAALLLISSLGVYSFLDDAKEKETLDEVSKLAGVAEQLSFRGEGSEVLFEFDVPDGVSVDFGTLSGSQNKWPEDAKNYCIKIGNNVRFYSSDAAFSNSKLNGPISFGSGRHMLSLSTKIEPNSGRLFVLISENRL